MSNSGFDAAHYDRETVWEGHRDDAVERDRAAATAAMVPASDRSVLDIGAGAGVVTDELRRRGHWVAALDLSIVALRHAGSPRILADAARLPTPDRAVDAVVSTEVIEHLPGHTLDQVVNELARVARRSIVVSVPNAEGLDSMQAKCADCGCCFHPWRHTRSFDRGALEVLFATAGFRLRELVPFGPPTRYPPAVLARLAQGFGGWLQPSAGTAVCPSCGNDERFVRRNNVATFVLRSGPGRVARQRPYWLLASFSRS